VASARRTRGRGAQGAEPRRLVARRPVGFSRYPHIMEVRYDFVLDKYNPERLSI